MTKASIQGLPRLLTPLNFAICIHFGAQFLTQHGVRHLLLMWLPIHLSPVVECNCGEQAKLGLTATADEGRPQLVPACFPTRRGRNLGGRNLFAVQPVFASGDAADRCCWLPRKKTAARGPRDLRLSIDCVRP